MSTKSELFNVLIADDSEVDRFLLKRAITSVAPRLHIVEEMDSGDGVVAYLSGQGPYADRDLFPLPDLLVLDSRMPGRGGIEVLEWLQTRDFPQMKIAFLADSSGVAFKPRALELGASYFFSKAVRSDELLRIARTLQAELERGAGRKVLLRNKYNQFYFQGECKWTPHYADGIEFDSFERAVHFAHEQSMVDEVDVVLVFAETGQTFAFPFPKAARDKNS